MGIFRNYYPETGWYSKGYVLTPLEMLIPQNRVLEIIFPSGIATVLYGDLP